MRASLRRKALNQTLFNKLNQAIRVGACEYGLIVAKIISITSDCTRSRKTSNWSFEIAEPSLGFSQNPSCIELKSLIMALIERLRQA